MRWLDLADEDRLTLRLADWPAPVRADWERAVGRRDRPRRASEGGPLPKPVSVDKWLDACGRFLGHLRRTGRLDAGLPLAGLASERNLEAFHRDLAEARLSGHTIVNYFAGLRAVLERMNPGRSFKSVTCPGGVSLRRIVPMGKRVIAAPPLGELEAWTRGLFEEGLRLGGGQRRRVQVRDAAMFAVLCNAGPRLRSVTEMRVDANLQRRGEEWWLALEPGNTKTGRALRVPLRPWVWPMVARYLAVERIELLGGRRHDALWVDWQGGTLDEVGVAKRVRWRSGKRFGRAFGPHMFRYAIATDAARAPGGDPLEASARLGHASPDTTALYTDPGAVGGAAARHAATLREARRRTEELAARTFPACVVDLGDDRPHSSRAAARNREG